MDIRLNYSNVVVCSTMQFPVRFGKCRRGDENIAVGTITQYFTVVLERAQAAAPENPVTLETAFIFTFIRLLFFFQHG